jgi:copper chaperone CopZ
MATQTYSVPGISCSHCEHAIRQELDKIGGLSSIQVDIDKKLVTVSGERIDEAAIVAAIDEAGYDAERINEE